MKNTWQLQEAKAQFSRVVRKAMTEGEQIITLHGEPAVYIRAAKKPAGKKRKHKFPDYRKQMNEIFGNKVISSKVMAEILDDNKGPC